MKSTSEVYDLLAVIFDGPTKMSPLIPKVETSFPKTEGRQNKDQSLEDLMLNIAIS